MQKNETGLLPNIIYKNEFKMDQQHNFIILVKTIELLVESIGVIFMLLYLAMDSWT